MAKDASCKTILSLDGDGIRGLITARILQDLENWTERRIYELFDLIVGTSTGGILAAGLPRPRTGQFGDPCTAKELAEIYSERGQEIFNRSFWKGVTSLSYGQMLCMAVSNPAAFLPVSFSSTPLMNLTSAITSAR